MLNLWACYNISLFCVALSVTFVCSRISTFAFITMSIVFILVVIWWWVIMNVKGQVLKDLIVFLHRDIHLYFNKKN